MKNIEIKRPDQQRIDRNLRFLLNRRGLLLKDFEAMIGASHGYFSRLLLHEHDMPISKLYAVAQVLDVNMQDLVEKEYALEQRREEIKSKIARLASELKYLDEMGHENNEH